MPHVAKGTGIPFLLATPNKNVGSQESSGIWRAFLLNTFLWTSKEEYSAYQYGNWHLINRRVSDTIPILPPMGSGFRQSLPE
jgi:hypothetical protein